MNGRRAGCCSQLYGLLANPTVSPAAPTTIVSNGTFSFNLLIASRYPADVPVSNFTFTLDTVGAGNVSIAGVSLSPASVAAQFIVSSAAPWTVLLPTISANASFLSVTVRVTLVGSGSTAVVVTAASASLPDGSPARLEGLLPTFRSPDLTLVSTPTRQTGRQAGGQTRSLGAGGVGLRGVRAGGGQASGR